MKRSLKLKEAHDEDEARKKLADSDIDIIRALEKMLPTTDPLVVERESLRKIIRKNRARGRHDS